MTSPESTTNPAELHNSRIAMLTDAKWVEVRWIVPDGVARAPRRNSRMFGGTASGGSMLALNERPKLDRSGLKA
jgi:hypothetical protein